MNNAQRKEIETLKADLETIMTRIEEIKEDEQGKLDNMPESLQESERGQAMQEGIENLENAGSEIQTAIDSLDSIQ